MTITLPPPVLDAARSAFPEAVRLRRVLHRSPEIGLHLPRTQAAVTDALSGLDMEVRAGARLSSVVGVLRGARPGPTVLLRADLDALPVQERSGLAFASGTPGVAHACGHDLHAAMLVAAAKVLAHRRAELAGQVVFAFQPGEEGWHGAELMLAEGLLEAAGERPSAAFALHVAPVYRAGTVHLREGPQLASSDVLRISVRGPAGADPIPVACEIVGALQAMVARRAVEPGALTVAQLRGGTAYNVLPDSAHLEGTVRAMSGSARVRLHREIRRVAEGVAGAHGMAATVDLELGYPTVVNDGPLTEVVHGVASRLFGGAAVAGMSQPLLAAEDFAYVLERVPGVLAFLGACPPATDPDRAAPNHSAAAVFDESAMLTGIALYAAVALRHLSTTDPGRC